MTTKPKKSIKNDSKLDFKTIKTFEDACKKLNLDAALLPDLSMIPEEFRKPIIAAYKLLIIYKAINNGWIPDWSKSTQWKYHSWFAVLSSGFGFSFSSYSCTSPGTSVGSRLCTDSAEKALYIAKQFEAEYKDYFLYSE